MLKREFVKVKFISGEWMGNKPPSEMTLIRQKALDLEQRGVVEILDSRTENKSVGGPEKNKAVKESPMNKMVSAAPQNKGGRPRKNSQ